MFWKRYLQKLIHTELTKFFEVYEQTISENNAQGTVYDSISDTETQRMELLKAKGVIK